MKVKLKPYMTIISILCVLVGIYFLWPIITEGSTTMPDSSVLAANTSDVNSINHHESNSIHANNGVVQPEQHTESTDAIVYVTGAIQSPGLYKVAASSTIGDVIKGAEGALPYGDIESINLAETVTTEYYRIND